MVVTKAANKIVGTGTPLHPICRRSFRPWRSSRCITRYSNSHCRVWVGRVALFRVAGAQTAAHRPMKPPQTTLNFEKAKFGSMFLSA